MMIRLCILLIFVLPAFGQDCTTNCNRGDRGDVIVRNQPSRSNDVASFYGENKRRAMPRIDDRTFLRRVSLDITGTLPSPQEVEAFLADNSSNKRAAFIDKLLQSENFAHRWTTLFEDMFNNRLIVNAATFRNGFEEFFRTRLLANMPMDQIAREFITSSGKAMEGAPTNFYVETLFDEVFRLDYLDDKVSQISQNWLGVDTSCISCHDGAYHLENVNKGLSIATRQQFWGMSAFLSGTYGYLRYADYDEDDEESFEKNLQIVDFGPDYTDERYGELYPYSEFFATDGEYLATSQAGQGQRSPRNGGLITPSYMFTGGGVKPGETRRAALARHITSDRQFARNMVNRVWAHFFGEGFVADLDGWDLGRIDEATAASFGTTVQARNVELMEHLTDTFMESGYDFKALIRLIAVSSLYQVDHGKVESNDNQGLGFWLSNVRDRRLEAEALVDSIRYSLGQDWSYVVMGRPTELLKTTWALPGKNEPEVAALYYPEYVNPVSLGYPNEEAYFFMQYTTMDLLNGFGRGNSFAMMPRSDETTIPTLLMAMNGEDQLFWLEDMEQAPFLQDLAASMDNGLSAEDATDRLFHRILFRDPTVKERQAVSSYLESEELEVVLPDAAWALMNHPDFWFR